ncbi:MAG: protein kinase [Bdellovibrionales bacterium]|nr:protein kinase [Bdellovibrionales bacterium]
MALSRVDSLDLPEGFILSRKFEIIGKLGGGWEGEVYSIREISTGIERAAKFFYPQRNRNNRAAKHYALKLHRLRNCSILIKYLFQDQIRYHGHDLTFLISDYVEGETLDEFLKHQKGKKLHPFQALHLLHVLAAGMQEIHELKEYHGDLHTGNIIVQRYGLNFQIKLVDLFHLGGASAENIKWDVCDLIRIFYDSLGGKKAYSKQPQVVKDICCGLKQTQILKKFRTAGQLKAYLENLQWE